MARITLHESPGAGFEAPFEMLDACHERVERMVALLRRIAGHLDARGGAVDEQARQAARDVMRYFDLAAPNHHLDEERHVFPALRANGQAALADRLEAEHREMSRQWSQVRATLVDLVDGRWDPASGPLWEGFAALYRRHAADEDGQAYPAARSALDAAALRAMSDEMARRRGIG